MRPLFCSGCIGTYPLNEEGLTQTGDLLGTPGYMAPELTRGSRSDGDVGQAADIYGLGAVLYELLTGRPPFRGASVADTLEQVRSLEPVPPRRLQPKVPRDLETVCLKCLHKEPKRRYSIAADLADDLGRFLNGHPIRARRTSLVERFGKWAWRRPALAALGVVSLLAVAALLGSGVWYQGQLRTALAEAEASRQRADDNYREARAAIGQMLARADARSQSGIPRLLELRREQQEAALAFYLRVADQPGRSREVRRDVASALLGAGELQNDLGRKEEARPNLERAAALFAELAAEEPPGRDDRAARVQCLNVRGYCLPPGEDALRCYREALAECEELVREEPASPGYRAALAAALVSLANGLITAAPPGQPPSHPEEVERYYLRAEQLRNDLAAEQPGARQHRLALAKIWINLGVLYQQDRDHRLADFQRCHDRAEADLVRLLDEEPHEVGYLIDLGQLRVIWAYEQLAQEKRDDAFADLTKNVTALEEVVRREPDAEQARLVLLRTYGVRAGVLDGLKRHEEAIADWKRLLELARPGPERDYQRLFLPLYYVRAGRHAEAVREVETLTAPLPNCPRPNQLIHLAQICAAAAAAVRADEKLPAKEQETLAEQYATRALELLAQARTAAGEEKWLELARDLLGNDDFDPLRGRTEFQRLLPP